MREKFTILYIFLLILSVKVRGVVLADKNIEYLIRYNSYISTEKRHELYTDIDVEVEKRMNYFSDFDTIIIKNASMNDIKRIKDKINNIYEVDKIYEINNNHRRKLNNRWNTRRRTISSSKHLNIRQIADLLRADRLWMKGYKGQGIDVAIFDTGLTRRRTFFRNIKDIVDFTDENNSADRKFDNSLLCLDTVEQ